MPVLPPCGENGVLSLRAEKDWTMSLFLWSWKLICPPSENDEKLAACQKLSFNLNRLHGSKKLFPSLPTSVWPHLVYKVGKGRYSEDLTLQVAAGTAENNIEIKFLIWHATAPQSDTHTTRNPIESCFQIITLSQWPTVCPTAAVPCYNNLNQGILKRSSTELIHKTDKRLMVLLFSPYLLICDIHIHFFWLNGFGYIVNVVFSAVIKNVLVLFPMQETKAEEAPCYCTVQRPHAHYMLWLCYRYFSAVIGSKQASSIARAE